MCDKLIRHGPLILALILAVFCAGVLMMYAEPMEDVFLDLSLMNLGDGVAPTPEGPDTKGWTVYTQEGSIRTELTPDGFGGYTGLQLGQTFYFSRVMEEELDSPTLQLGTVERQFSVWLDDMLIYTDCPDLDNRIGYVQLPMSEWVRDDPITISLPADYRGKTLTVAQSFPEWTETSSVVAWPASVRLYCGYAYESGLISETFQTALLAAVAFALTVSLLAAFVRSRDWSILCLAVVAFLWMAQKLAGTSYFFRYYAINSNSLITEVPRISALALLCYLTLQGGTRRKFLWIPVGAFALVVIADAIILSVFPGASTGPVQFSTVILYLPLWFAVISLTVLLVMGTIWWRKENRFYRLFIPLAFTGIAVSWVMQFFLEGADYVWQQITANLLNYQIHYVYTHTLSGVTVAALLAAFVEAVRAELNRRTEQQLMQQRHELAMSSYENLRRQHEEVMMLRHDMLRHYHTLHDMDSDEKRTAYLAELIGQNQKIRPIVESGNEMLDIIINGRLGAAVDAGIHVEIPHVTAPAELRLSNPDLCALVMNIMDNAISAAAKAKAPFVKLTIHEKAGYLAVFCENSFDPEQQNRSAKKETVPKHGLGLKIIRSIVAKYEGVVLDEVRDGNFVVEIVIPLS